MKRKTAILMAIIMLCNIFVVSVSAVPGGSSGNLPEIVTKNVPQVYIFSGKDGNGADTWIEFKFTKNAAYMDNDVLCIPLRCGLFELLGFESTYDWLYRECIVRTREQILTMVAWNYTIYDQGVLAETSNAYAAILCNVAYVPLVPFLNALKDITVTEDKEAGIIYIS